MRQTPLQDAGHTEQVTKRELLVIEWVICQDPVLVTLDSAIYRINHYPVDKYHRNQLHYLLDRDLSGG